MDLVRSIQKVSRLNSSSVSFREDQGRWIDRKMDWKRLEHWFRSCRKVSYGMSLAGWFWLFKLEEMNEGWPSINRESNGIFKRVKWWSLERNHVKLQTRKVWLLFWSKLIQSLSFNVLITYGSYLNIIRSKSAQKIYV